MTLLQLTSQEVSAVPFPRLISSSQIIIPARLASTRLPEKLLLRETGKPLLQHTYEATRTACRPHGTTVAVDCERLQRLVEGFGGQAVLTEPQLASATQRVAAAAQQLPHIEIFVHVEGDQPEITPRAIDQVVDLLESHPAASLATLACPIRDRQRLEDPACIKVVRDHEQRALYFSRSPIPHARSWDEQTLASEPPLFWEHVSLFAYRREFLQTLGSLPASPLAEVEKLELLRYLQAGCQIMVGSCPQPIVGIDTPDDYRAFVWRASRQPPTA